MRSTSRLMAATAALCAMMAAPDASAFDLKTQKGYRQLGGLVGIQITSVIPDEGDSVTGTQLIIAPEFAYFVIDNLALDVALDTTIGFGDAFENDPTLVGFALGARYLIPIGSSRIYIGARLGASFSIPEEGDTAKSFVMQFPVGFLLPLLNEYVALDIGTRINVAMDLAEGGATTVRVPIGYLGVQSFW